MRKKLTIIGASLLLVAQLVTIIIQSIYSISAMILRSQDTVFNAVFVLIIVMISLGMLLLLVGIAFNIVSVVNAQDEIKYQKNIVALIISIVINLLCIIYTIYQACISDGIAIIIVYVLCLLLSIAGNTLMIIELCKTKKTKDNEKALPTNTGFLDEDEKADNDIK